MDTTDRRTPSIAMLPSRSYRLIIAMNASEGGSRARLCAGSGAAALMAPHRPGDDGMWSPPAPLADGSVCSGGGGIGVARIGIVRGASVDDQRAPAGTGGGGAGPVGLMGHHPLPAAERAVPKPLTRTLRWPNAQLFSPSSAPAAAPLLPRASERSEALLERAVVAGVLRLFERAVVAGVLRCVDVGSSNGMPYCIPLSPSSLLPPKLPEPLLLKWDFQLAPVLTQPFQVPVSPMPPGVASVCERCDEAPSKATRSADAINMNG